MYSTVVVGTDGSSRAEKAVQEAVDLAKSEGARVYLVAAFSATERQWEQIQGDPAEVIIEVAEREKADLIVVGNKGMTGTRRFFLGSVPNKVLNHAPCSVMVVRTD